MLEMAGCKDATGKRQQTGTWSDIHEMGGWMERS
jgi:hypothetical protein